MRSDFFSTIRFSDIPAHGKFPIVQILRATKFQHPTHGLIEITPETLKQMKENFDKKVRRQDIAIDYFHDNEGIAAGWITELFFNDADANELWAKVDWTRPALQKLEDKELRYFSPEFSFQWTDPETGVQYENVLFGGGLTNRPQVKDMAPIVLKEVKGEEMDKIKELEGQIVKLNEQIAAQGEAEKKMQEGMDAKAAMIQELEAKIAEMMKQLEALKGENDTMMKENAEMKKDVALKEKENKFNVMLSEGKVCEAQRKAYLDGDMDEFTKNAGKVNLNEKGNSENKNDEGKSENVDDEILKLAEKKVKEDKITMAEAISVVLKENPELKAKRNK